MIEDPGLSAFDKWLKLSGNSNLSQKEKAIAKFAWNYVLDLVSEELRANPPHKVGEAQTFRRITKMKA